MIDYREDPILNVAYIKLIDRPVAYTQEAKGCMIDYDIDGNVIGIEILSLPYFPYSCGCITCDEAWRKQFPYTDSRRTAVYMILCPECGNKRCPRATLHSNPCTRSNEPNQEGSVYQTGDTSWMEGLTSDEIQAELRRRIVEASGIDPTDA